MTTEEKKSKLSRKLADSFLEVAKNDITNTDLFYISLEKALFNFLKSRFDFQTSEFSKDNIKAKLSKRTRVRKDNYPPTLPSICSSNNSNSV